MGAFWFFLPNTVFKRARTFTDRFRMLLTEQFVRLENEKGYTEWPWTKFLSYYESPHFFHLYFNTRSFFLIPKEAVEKDDQMDEIRRLLRSKISKK
jgi:hypothetical protein